MTHRSIAKDMGEPFIYLDGGPIIYGPITVDDAGPLTVSGYSGYSPVIRVNENGNVFCNPSVIDVVLVVVVFITLFPIWFLWVRMLWREVFK